MKALKGLPPRHQDTKGHKGKVIGYTLLVIGAALWQLSAAVNREFFATKARRNQGRRYW
jgi:hypothetical protein